MTTDKRPLKLAAVDWVSIVLVILIVVIVVGMIWAVKDLFNNLSDLETAAYVEERITLEDGTSCVLVSRRDRPEIGGLSCPFNDNL